MMAALTTKPEMPSFSYAQAAKGLATTAPSPQPAKSATDATSEDDLPQAEVSEASSSKTPAETSKDSEKVEAAVDPESKSTTTGSSKNAISGTSSPSFGTASTSTLPKEDDISVIPNGTSDSTWDKQSQASVPVDTKSNVAEDSKTDESSDTTEKTLPPKELKAAPLPTVNIWQQRKEAQEAKAKAGASAFKPVAPNTSKVSNTKPTAASPLPAADSAETSKAGNKKKVTESSSESTLSQGKDRKRADAGKARDDSSKKPSNRLPRSHDESTESAPPSVADATAWPTPQIALGEEKRKAQEKNEKTDRNERSPSIRGKEKWTPVPYVPTAVFNTPLPSARRGGRPSRGGRDNGRGGAHGSHNASGADNKSVSGQNQASSKQAALSERGRVETNLARTNSLPAQGRRPTSVDVNVQSEPRRPSQGLDRSRGESRTKASEDVHSTTNGTQTNASDATAKAQREGRSGKAQEFIPANRGVDNGAKMGTLPAEGQGNNRFTPSHERRFEGIPRSGEFPRDSNGFVPKERDHRDFNRDKGEFQRDREQQRERGESRPERGRGGYRGRGGHSYGNGQQNQHFSNSQISQHPFIPAKSFGVNDRQRPQQQQQQQQQQQGFQNGTQSHNSGHRLSLRSPSLPNSAGLYGAYPLPEINTMYAGYQPMHTGPMTAVPYQPYMEPFSLIGMIQMQLEYYFSVDNLCKDMFLRRHMDSQGFVLLTFIASFKRIKNLTEDFEFLRQCCRQLRNVEYHFGEDGYDRLRPRDTWEQWVLPVDQRDQSAQNEGPSAPNFHYSKPHDRHDDHVTSPHNGIMPLANGFGHGNIQTANGFPNGTADHEMPRTSLSSTAPEFTPLAPAEIQNESSNVGAFYGS